MRTLRVAMAQINTLVGDLEGNRNKIIDFTKKAKSLGADIVSFPELSITGYPPEDLVYKPAFIRDNIAEVGKIAKSCSDIVSVVGFVDTVNANLYNSAAVLYEGKIQAIYHKRNLPNYGVFDEKRYFYKGDNYLVFELNDISIGVNICEDIWHTYPTKKIVDFGGAELVININSSPYDLDKYEERKQNISLRSKENNVFLAYNNMVGGQDELVFDGAAMIADPDGNILREGERFKEQLIVEDITFSGKKKEPLKEKTKDLISKFRSFSLSTPVSAKKPIDKKYPEELNREGEAYKALVLGVSDYVRKNGFDKALVALSGGIDSALTLAIAVDALGKENLLALYLPSKFSSKESKEDAFAMAKKLGVKIEEISIEKLFRGYLKELEPFFKGRPFDKTEENVQARIRGNIVMAFSNKFGHIVLSTGNKSEFSVGYATLYGDMAGGFSVLKDVYKTEVYGLAKYRNSISDVIPRRIISKVPSAELREDQKDQDTLPEYSLLDTILKLYIEEYATAEEIIANGYPKEIVKSVVQMVDANEYKRRQSPPGIKITSRAFGRDRRMPITQKYLVKM